MSSNGSGGSYCRPRFVWDCGVVVVVCSLFPSYREERNEFTFKETSRVHIKELIPSCLNLTHLLTKSTKY